HADHDSGEFRRGEHRHRNSNRHVDARGNQRHDDEDDRLAVPRGPMLGFRSLRGRDGGGPVAHLPFFSSFSSFSSFFSSFSPGFSSFTLAPSERPTPPSLTTRSPALTPLTICASSPSRTPTSTLRSCATESEPTTYTAVPPSDDPSSAEVGTTIASLTAPAVMVT